LQIEIVEIAIDERIKDPVADLVLLVGVIAMSKEVTKNTKEEIKVELVKLEMIGQTLKISQMPMFLIRKGMTRNSRS